MTEEKKPYVKRYRLGRVSGTIWLNKDDEGKQWFNTTIARRYESNGEWKDSASYSRDDLANLAQVAQMALWWICEHEAASAEEQPQS